MRIYSSQSHSAQLTIKGPRLKGIGIFRSLGIILSRLVSSTRNRTLPILTTRCNVAVMGRANAELPVPQGRADWAREAS
ncbi:hypothetical protein BGX38DRAFT_1151651 [Terfezia claveryi]|nr:hypothetical protein BGX38DRAFT_1151651 [Terfezia claveryi]